MNYGSEPADQVVRYSLEGAEFALRISGTAAKNFFIFAQAVLHDSKKTHGKTHLIRLLKEQKPLKFFTVDKNRMHDFARAAKAHGLLFCPIRDKMDPDHIEIAILQDDASKANRIIDYFINNHRRFYAFEEISQHFAICTVCFNSCVNSCIQTAFNNGQAISNNRILDIRSKERFQQILFQDFGDSTQCFLLRIRLSCSHPAVKALLADWRIHRTAFENGRITSSDYLEWMLQWPPTLSAPDD